MDFLCKYNLCRLCLCKGDTLVDIFEDYGKREFMIADTIHDLLRFQAVRVDGVPWLTCVVCLGKLSEFRLFKERAQECKVAFEARVAANHEKEWLETCGQNSSSSKEFDGDVTSEDGEESCFDAVKTETHDSGDGRGDLLMENVLFSVPIKEERNDEEIMEETSMDAQDVVDASKGDVPERSGESALQLFGVPCESSDEVVKEEPGDEVDAEVSTDCDEDATAKDSASEHQQLEADPLEGGGDSVGRQMARVGERSSVISWPKDVVWKGPKAQKVFVLEGSLSSDLQKRRKRISLDKKMEMVLRHEWGQSISSIAREYDYAISTVSSILRNSLRIKNHLTTCKVMSAVKKQTPPCAMYRITPETRVDSPTSCRRKRNRITLERKLEMVRRYESGQSLSSIAREFGYPVSTTSFIVKDSEHIKNRCEAVRKDMLPQSAASAESPKELQIGTFREVERRLLVWVKGNMNNSVPLTLKAIRDKARGIYKEMKAAEGHGGKLDASFVASDEWFRQFIIRAGLQTKPTPLVR